MVVEKEGRIGLEIASGDTQGSGIFLHDEPVDRYVVRRGNGGDDDMCCADFGNE